MAKKSAVLDAPASSALTIPRAQLTAAVASCMPTLAKNSPSQILTKFLVRAEGSRLTLGSCSGDAWTEADIDVLDAADFSVLVSGVDFNHALKKAPGDHVTLVVEERYLVIKAEKATFKVATLDPLDFPGMPPIPAEQISIAFGTLERLILRAAPFVDDEKLRATCGVLVRSVEGKLAVAATNTHIAIRDGDPETEWSRDDVIVSTSCIQSLKGLDIEPETEVTIASDGWKLWLHGQGVRCCWQCVSGSYPAIDRIFARTNESSETKGTWMMRVDELASALERVLVSAVKRVFMSAEDGFVRLRSYEELDRTQVREALVSYEAGGAEMAKTFSFAVNGNYLKTLITAPGTQSVLIGFTHPDRPVTVVAPDVPSYDVLVMPMAMKEG